MVENSGQIRKKAGSRWGSDKAGRGKGCRRRLAGGALGSLTEQMGFKLSPEETHAERAKLSAAGRACAKVLR